MALTIRQQQVLIDRIIDNAKDMIDELEEMSDADNESFQDSISDILGEIQINVIQINMDYEKLQREN